MSNVRTYTAKECAVFQRSNAKHGELSNYHMEFPFQAGPVWASTVENVFQGAKATELEVQLEILAAGVPGDANAIAWRWPRIKIREDWDQVRLQVMRASLLLKYRAHTERLSAVLEATGDLHIVEKSKRDRYWAAVPQKGEGKGTLVGVNALGRLWMQIRGWVRDDPRELARQTEMAEQTMREMFPHLIIEEQSA